MQCKCKYDMRIVSSVKKSKIKENVVQKKIKQLKKLKKRVTSGQKPSTTGLSPHFPVGGEIKKVGGDKIFLELGSWKGVGGGG